MTDSSSSATNDLMSLFGGGFALVSRSITQFQQGVANFLSSIENFNSTMEQMNGVAQRINGLLDELEPVVKAAVPQITRTLRAADEMVEQMSGPIERVAPGLMRLADTLSSPVLTSFPRDLGQVVEVFSDVARRMQPLGQLAETAGGFFGLNPLAALRGTSSSKPSPPPPAPAASVSPELLPEVQILASEEQPEPPRRPAPRTKAAATKSTGTRSTGKKSTGKRAPTKRAAATRSPAKRSRRS